VPGSPAKAARDVGNFRPLDKTLDVELFPPIQRYCEFASHVLDSSIVSLRESSRLSSDLRRAAIYEEVSPCNVTALVRRQKNHGVSDLVGCPDSTERRRGGCGLLDLVDLGVA
jgi:hypothetical protein